MLIVQSRSVQRDSCGFMLAPCAICELPRIHEVLSVQSERRLYALVPAGGESYHGREVVCEVCHHTEFLKPGTVLDLAARRSDHAFLLNAVPSPQRERMIADLKREAEREQHPERLSPAERTDRLHAIFRQYESRVQQAKRRAILADPRVVAVFLGLLAIAAGLGLYGLGAAALSMEASTALFEWAGWAVLLAVSVVLVAVPVTFIANRAAFVLLAQVQVPLAKALASMQPSRQELAQVLEDLRRQRRLMGRVNADRLWARIAAVRNASP